MSSCMKALRDLEHRGHIVLPVSIKRGNAIPRRLLEAVATPLDVPDQVGDVQGLKITLVESTEHVRIWNEMEIIRDTSHVLIISLEVVPCPSYRIFRGHNTDSFTRMIFRRDLWFQAIFFNGGRFG